jgi:predicted XRE-type DNA-binding protein
MNEAEHVARSEHLAAGTSEKGKRRQDGARARLIAAIAEAMAVRGLSQVQAARLCQTDQPTLSKVLRRRTTSVSLDKLVAWLLLLGRSVEIRVGETDFHHDGTLTAVTRRRPGASETTRLPEQDHR